MSANNPNLGGAGGLSKRDSTMNNDLDGKSLSDSYGDGRGSISEDESEEEQQAAARRVTKRRKTRDEEADEIDDDQNDDEEEE